MSAPRVDAVGDESDSTISELLIAARRMETPAWRALVDQYSNVIAGWCRNSGLSPEDSADVVQMVLAQVAIHINNFRKDGEKAAFRRWLRTVTRSKIVDFQRKDNKEPRAEGGSEARERIVTIPGHGDSSVAENPTFQLRHEQFLSLVARLKLEFERSTWEAFWLTVVDDLTSTDAAALLNMTPNAVRLAKGRVLQRIRREALNLEKQNKPDA